MVLILPSLPLELWEHIIELIDDLRGTQLYGVNRFFKELIFQKLYGSVSIGSHPKSAFATQKILEHAR
jgi:hypothetical protein